MSTVEQQCEEYLKALPNVLKRTLELWAIICRDAISLQSPVGNTGALKAGTTYEITEGPNCIIQNLVPYAAAVEFGSLHPAQSGKLWRFMGTDGWVFTQKIKEYSIPAQQFFFSTIEGVLPELDSLTDDALQELGDAVFK